MRLGAAADPIVDAARLAVTLRRTRAEHLDRLRAELPSSIPMLFVPELALWLPRRLGY